MKFRFPIFLFLFQIGGVEGEAEKCLSPWSRVFVVGWLGCTSVWAPGERVCVYAWAPEGVCAWRCVCVCDYACVWVCVWVCVCVCVCVCVSVCKHEIERAKMCDEKVCLASLHNCSNSRHRTNQPWLSKKKFVRWQFWQYYSKLPSLISN